MRIEELLTRPHAHDESHEGVPAWMATFADLSILLLTFFVVLLSFANMDVRKFREMLGSVRDAFGVEEQARRDSTTAASRDGTPAILPVWDGAPAPGDRIVPAAVQMERAPDVIRSAFEDLEGLGEPVADGDTVTLRVDGRLLFASGSAEVKPGAETVLDRVLGLMQAYTFDVHILGHTDSLPIETARFPSNWELSAARAAAALRYLVERGVDPRRLVAVGFADSRPVDTQDTPEGRSRNRRVEFVFRASEALPGGDPYRAKPRELAY